MGALHVACDGETPKNTWGGCEDETPVPKRVRERGVKRSEVLFSLRMMEGSLENHLAPREGLDWGGGVIMAGEITLGTDLDLTSRFPRLNPSTGLNLAAGEISGR